MPPGQPHRICVHPRAAAGPRRSDRGQSPCQCVGRRDLRRDQLRRRSDPESAAGRSAPPVIRYWSPTESPRSHAMTGLATRIWTRKFRIDRRPSTNCRVRVSSCPSSISQAAAVESPSPATRVSSPNPYEVTDDDATSRLTSSVLSPGLEARRAAGCVLPVRQLCRLDRQADPGWHRDRVRPGSRPLSPRRGVGCHHSGFGLRRHRRTSVSPSPPPRLSSKRPRHRSPAAVERLS